MDVSDLNILYIYNNKSVGSINRANAFQRQLKQYKIESRLSCKLNEVENDDFSHIVVDKHYPQYLEDHNVYYVTNYHRDDKEHLDPDCLLIPDYPSPFTICRTNLQIQYESTYRYINPLVERIEKGKDPDTRLFVIGNHNHLFKLAVWMLQNANDVSWSFTTHNLEKYKLLQDFNELGHKVVYTTNLSPLLSNAKYVIHGGGHQTTMECVENQIVQYIIPPENIKARYYYQHAFAIQSHKIGTFAFEFFHKVPYNRKYRMIRNIRCNFRTYKSGMEEFHNKIEKVKKQCLPHTIFTKNSKT